MKEIFENKTILITGGTGYLGRALTREILKHNPASIRVFSRDEVKHHKFQEDFNYNEKIRNFIGDVRDYERVLKASNGADIVIHAAALKRLDILEYNVEESIKTNIMGSLNVVNACLANNVEKAILVSTDKACSPVNTYGACKFVSERIFTETNHNKGDLKTIFTVVRYGNVIESTGSVIPFFLNKIKNDEEIPLTDARMTRFIITPEQAVQLVFNSIKYAVGGEVFIPKLDAIKITDLIDMLKDFAGKPDIKTKVIGIRPGEKFHELMINSSEMPRTYSFKDLYIVGSCISKFVPTDEAIYVKEGKLLTEDDMEEYSSGNELIPKDEVYKTFKDMGLLENDTIREANNK